ncbi:hypothetical protein [Streptomyces sp. NPDC054863]
MRYDVPPEVSKVALEYRRVGDSATGGCQEGEQAGTAVEEGYGQGVQECLQLPAVDKVDGDELPRGTAVGVLGVGHGRQSAAAQV